MCTPAKLLHHLLAFFLSLTFSLSLPATISSASAPQPVNLILPSDAVALLTFKSKGDTDNKLLYNLNERFDYCQWQGVKCVQGRVVVFVLQGAGLRGILAGDTLSRLDQLRVLSLRNNSLSGEIPNLAGLFNLKTLFLGGNFFSGEFPPSILSLHRLRTLDLSHNNLSGPLPEKINGLDQLNYLRLELNRFNGAIPALNQTSLEVFNVSGNNLTGPIPSTETLSKFGISSFLLNPSLCGEILNKICDSNSPFFDSPAGRSAPAPVLQNAQSQSGEFVVSPPSANKREKIGVILGFIIGVLVLIAAILSIFVIFKKRKEQIHSKSGTDENNDDGNGTETVTANDTIARQVVNTEVDIKEKKLQLKLPQQSEKSGNLIFCEGETAMYNLELLMRASAELLGRGSIGTTYKV